MNKRAEWTILQTMTIIGGILVAFILVTIVTRFTSTDGLENTFLGKDVSMLSDAILSVPGSVEIFYNTEFETGIIVLNHSLISLYSSNTTSGKALFEFFFIPRGDVETQNSEAEKSLFYLIKKDNLYYLSNNLYFPILEQVKEEMIETSDNKLDSNE